jgi:murein L,D-transpeptidase YcbB/YkuD
VYLHDTNFKLAFASQKRFYSHGCIRLDKPMALAEKLLDNKLDTTFLKACMKNETPQTIPLHASVPVMVVYLTAWPDEQGKITYFQDIYHLNQ